jgi:hypothetical protein
MIGFAVQKPGDSHACVARGRELIGHDPGFQQVSLYAKPSMHNHLCAIGY